MQDERIARVDWLKGEILIFILAALTFQLTCTTLVSESTAASAVERADTGLSFPAYLDGADGQAQLQDDHESESKVDQLIESLTHRRITLDDLYIDPAKKEVTPASELTKMGKPAVPALLRALTRLTSPDDRVPIIAILGQIGDKAAQPRLLDLLLNGDLKTSKAAADALGRLGDRSAVPALVGVLAAGPDELAEPAAKALFHLGYQPDSIDLQVDYYLSLNSLTDVVKIGPSAMPLLIRRLAGKTESPERKSVAAQALLALGWQPSTPEQKVVFYLALRSTAQIEGVGELAVPSLIRALSDEATRGFAITALGGIGGDRAVGPLIRIWTNPNYSEAIHGEAANSLIQIGQPAISALLYEMNKGSRSRNLEGLFLDIVPRIGTAAIPQLLQAMHTDSFFEKGTIAKSLAKIGWHPASLDDQVLFDVLLEKFDDIRPLGREAARPLLEAAKTLYLQPRLLSLLGELGDTSAIPTLLSVLHRSYASVEEQKAAADSLRTLGWIPQTLADQILLLLISDNIAPIRELGAPAIPALMEISTNDNSALQPRIVAALALSGRSAIPNLVAILINKDASDRMRWTAQAALTTIGWQPMSIEETIHYYLISGGRLSEHIDKVVALGPPAVPYLLAVWKADRLIGTSAAVALNKLGWQPQTVEDRALTYLYLDQSKELVGLGRAAVPTLLNVVARRDFYSADRAIEALARIGDREAVPGLIDALSRGDVDRVTRALEEIGDPRAIPPLLDALHKKTSGSFDPHDTFTLTSALGNFRDAGTVRGLLAAAAIERENPPSSAAMRSLVSIGEAAIPVLRDELSTGNAGDGEQAIAAQVLGIIGGKDVVPLLAGIAQNESKAESVRAACLEALGWSSDKDLIPLLSGFARSRSELIQRAAIASLGRIGAESSVDDLMGVFRNDKSLWRVIADALADIGTTKAVNALLEIDDYAVDQEGRFPLLGKIGSIGDRAAVPRLRSLARNGNRAAIGALAQIGDRSSVPELIGALEFDDEEAQLSAAQALIAFHATEALPALMSVRFENRLKYELLVKSLGDLGDKSLTPHLLGILSGGDQDERRVVLFALDGVKDKRAFPEVLAAVQDKGEGAQVRGAAAIVLGDIGNRNAIPPLIELLRGGENEFEMPGAAFALGELHARESVPALIVALKPDEPYVEENVVEALGKIGDKSAIPALQRKAAAADNDDPGLDKALARLGNKEGLARLHHALETDLFDEKTVEALGDIGDRTAIPLLTKRLAETQSASFKWLHSNDEGIQSALIEALGSIGGKEVVPALVEWTKDRNCRLRKAAVEALGKIGGKEASAALSEAEKDVNPYVVESAAKAMSEARKVGRTEY